MELSDTGRFRTTATLPEKLFMTHESSDPRITARRQRSAQMIASAAAAFTSPKPTAAFGWPLAANP